MEFIVPFCLILLLIIISIIFVSLLFKFHRLQAHNECPAVIETFDGSNSPYHPSVLYFKEGWNGHKFWMAETPFPFEKEPYRDRWECPSIHVSDDGLSWSVPDGGRNPIDNLTDNQIHDFDYFSDPELVQRCGRLECWYRLTRRYGKSDYTSESSHTLCRRISEDGVHWSDREVVLDISGHFHKELASQAVIFDDNYKMWAIDLNATSDEERVVFLKRDESGNWSDIQKCILSGNSCHPWHIDVSHFDNSYWLVVYEYTGRISLWKSGNGIEFRYTIDLLNRKNIDGSFDERGYYRASLVKVSDNDYRLYFSARSYYSSHIGVLKGTDVLNMSIISCSDRKFCSFGKMVKIYISKIRTRLVNITRL